MQSFTKHSRLDTIPACDRQTDRQTDNHATTAKTALTLSVARVKSRGAPTDTSF